MIYDLFVCDPRFTLFFFDLKILKYVNVWHLSVTILDNINNGSIEEPGGAMTSLKFFKFLYYTIVNAMRNKKYVMKVN